MNTLKKKKKGFHADDKYETKISSLLLYFYFFTVINLKDKTIRFDKNIRIFFFFNPTVFT